jgi:hypothetical protein
VPVMNVSRFERFFGVAASLDVELLGHGIHEFERLDEQLELEPRIMVNSAWRGRKVSGSSTRILGIP